MFKDRRGRYKENHSSITSSFEEKAWLSVDEHMHRWRFNKETADKPKTEEVDDRYPWFHHIADLPLVDYIAGPDGMTTNFDP